MNADIVIIGGGIMGLFAAMHLAEQKAGRIVVVEKRFVGAGSSGKSGAILRQHYSHETTVRMSREGLAAYGSFQDRTGFDIGFRRTGMAFLCHAGDRAALEANVALQRSLGVDVEILDAPPLRDLEPRAVFADDILGAFEAESGFVEPAATLAALLALCRAGGVEVIQGQPVVDVRIGSGKVRGVTLSGGEQIGAEVVVNAGGPWAGRICRRLGIELPLQAIRPEQAYFAPPSSHGREKLIFGDLLTGLYWKPEPAGWTRVGKMSYDGDQEIVDPDHYDEGVSHAFIEMCRARIAQRVPAYRDAVSWGGCSALYTITPDAHALIGAAPGLEGFFVVSGFSGHGFKLGPSVGRGVAWLIAGGDRGAFEPDFFALDRFEKGNLVSTSYRYGILG